MTTQQVANRLVELCRKAEYETAYKELYSNDIVSIEPDGAPSGRVEGMEAIAAKGKMFQEMTEEFYGIEVSDPIVAENFFSCTMSLDSKMKGMPRAKMDEVCLYQVKDGKIVLEQFFYTVPPQQ